MRAWSTPEPGGAGWARGRPDVAARGQAAQGEATHKTAPMRRSGSIPERQVGAIGFALAEGQRPLRHGGGSRPLQPCLTPSARSRAMCKRVSHVTEESPRMLSSVPARGQACPF